MNETCQELQDLLAERGPSALRDDPAAQEHVAECSSCYPFLERLSDLERGLAALPRVDAPDHVVQRLLDRPELQEAERPAPRSWSWPRIPRLAWGGLATAAVLLVLSPLVVTQRGPFWSRKDELPETFSRLEIEQGKKAELDGEGYVGDYRLKQKTDAEELNREVAANEPIAKRPDAGRAGGDDVDTFLFNEADAAKPSTSTKFSDEFIQDLPVPGRFYQDVTEVTPEARDSVAKDDDKLHGSREREFKAQVGGISNVDPMSQGQESQAEPSPIEERDAITGDAGVDSSRAQGGYAVGPLLEPQPIEESLVTPVTPEIARHARIQATVRLELLVGADGAVHDVKVLDCTRPGFGLEEAAEAAVRRWRFLPAAPQGTPVAMRHVVTVEFPPPAPAEKSSLEGAAGEFLAARALTEGLRFREAAGYWANTYVPGDPAMRVLQARLSGWDRSTTLHGTVRPTAQPFDAPRDAALAVYLHGDRRGLDGEGRMLLQLGLQGTEQYAGRRPAMNLALVLDLRGAVDDDTAIRARALVEALHAARQPDDRFRLVVAGEQGGLLVDAENFRYGFLRVALDRLFAGEAIEDAEALGLVDSVTAAIRRVAGADDPDAPLGSSAVILATPGGLGGDLSTLIDVAGQSAVAGIPLSVVALDGEAEPRELERLALAGQGRRRLLDAAAAATGLVDRELSAASRAVARAVRLRIRLAPGVRLVDVIGSGRLDERRAQQVRRAERSIDLRLARNLGIQADRGEDEDGIQIVIPAFYAGDSHTVLLDLVAPGPGPVADVTVRYKDLVHQRNGVAQAGLSLDDRLLAAGPLERNVLHNFLAWQLAGSLAQAGDALAAGDAPRAATILDEACRLRAGLVSLLPDLSRDVDLLGAYAGLLRSGQADARLADSLHYAARLRVQPRHVEVSS